MGGKGEGRGEKRKEREEGKWGVEGRERGKEGGPLEAVLKSASECEWLNNADEFCIIDV